MLPAAVLLAIAGAPLWGPAVTLILVKAVAAVFVVVGILWYRADDRPAADTFSSVQEKPLYSEAGFPIDPITGEEVFEEAHGENIPEKQVANPRRAWDVPLRSSIPVDASLFREYNSWALYYSKEEAVFYVQSTDYHPKPLRLTGEMIHEMVIAVERDTSNKNGEA